MSEVLHLMVAVWATELIWFVWASRSELLKALG